MQYHPDHNSSTEANQKFRKICKSYETLKDPQKRAAYNQFSHETFEDNHKTFEIRSDPENGRPDNIARVIFIIYGITLFICSIISFFTWNIPLEIIK
ncbi:DnaJ domain-containing protein [Bartonella tribocorum]|uniref:DnaJ domain-containing protein n=1 Tax=Bartonella tribocorum TaxID=85701 RepID=UPI003D7BC93E